MVQKLRLAIQEVQAAFQIGAADLRDQNERVPWCLHRTGQAVSRMPNRLGHERPGSLSPDQLSRLLEVLQGVPDRPFAGPEPLHQFGMGGDPVTGRQLRVPFFQSGDDARPVLRERERHGEWFL